MNRLNILIAAILVFVGAKSLAGKIDDCKKQTDDIRQAFTEALDYGGENSDEFLLAIKDEILNKPSLGGKLKGYSRFDHLPEGKHAGIPEDPVTLPERLSGIYHRWCIRRYQKANLSDGNSMKERFQNCRRWAINRETEGESPYWTCGADN